MSQERTFLKLCSMSQRLKIFISFLVSSVQKNIKPLSWVQMLGCLRELLQLIFRRRQHVSNSAQTKQCYFLYIMPLQLTSKTVSFKQKKKILFRYTVCKPEFLAIKKMKAQALCLSTALEWHVLHLHQTLKLGYFLQPDLHSSFFHNGKLPCIVFTKRNLKD